MGLLHAGTAGCLWVSPLSTLLPSIFAFRDGLRWSAEFIVWVQCHQVGRFVWLQPAAIGFCLSRLLPTHSAVHDPNVLSVLQKVLCSTVHYVQVQQKIPDMLTCMSES